MSPPTVTAWNRAPAARWFTRDGAPHVPLLDTVWNAFSETEEGEWEGYLRRRSAQGFTGVMMSALPTWHDRSENAGSRTPFAVRDDGTFDFARLDTAYFSIARERVARVVAHGLTPVIVVLWSNYVAGSAPNSLRPGQTLPADRRRQLVSWVVDELAVFEPVLLISGDDPFTTDESSRVYLELLEELAARAPGLLRSFHTWPDADLPASLAGHRALDFITLQSGHSRDDGAKAIELATQAVARFPDKPILNLEPAYEGHGHVRATGRFSREEVRRVLWTSVLSGAAAGIGYGAHGVWQWHRPGSRFRAADFSGQPFDWQDALGFDGATDAAFLRQVWETEGLFTSSPAQGLIDRDDDGARVAASRDRIAVYLPHARDLHLNTPVGRVRAWDLDGRTPLVPEVDRAASSALIAQTPLNGDVLLLAEPTPGRPGDER